MTKQINKFGLTAVLGLTLAGISAFASSATSSASASASTSTKAKTNPKEGADGRCFVVDVMATDKASIPNAQKLSRPIGTAALILGTTSEGDDLQIMLSEGKFDFSDADGSDGGAALSLPIPSSSDPKLNKYSVNFRLFGTPGAIVNARDCLPARKYKIQHGAEISSIETRTYCQQDIVTVEPNMPARDVAIEFLSAFVTVDGILTSVPLFDARFKGYFWQEELGGRARRAELRLCPQSNPAS